jgi:hypothetical protein
MVLKANEKRHKNQKKKYKLGVIGDDLGDCSSNRNKYQINNIASVAPFIIGQYFYRYVHCKSGIENIVFVQNRSTYVVTVDFPNINDYGTSLCTNIFLFRRKRH